MNRVIRLAIVTRVTNDQGDQGDQGDVTSDQGDKGDKGDQGDQGDEGEQGEVSTIMLGLLESSGFRKYGTLSVFQLFSERICLDICICVLFHF